MSAPDDDTLRAILAGMQHGPVHITADRCTGDSRAVAAVCDLVRAAPALAAEVLRLRAERDELRAVCDDLHIDVVRARDALDDMRVRAERAEAERDALRAAAEEYARSHARSGGAL